METSPVSGSVGRVPNVSVGAPGKGAPAAAAKDAGPGPMARDAVDVRPMEPRLRKRLADAVDVVTKAMKTDELHIGSALSALVPGGGDRDGDPVVRDLRRTLDAYGEIRVHLLAAKGAKDPVRAAEALEKALDKHVEAYDTLKEARRNLYEGSYGRLEGAEEEALESVSDALQTAIYTQTRIVLAQDVLENP